MKYTDFKLFNSKGAALAMCGILSIFGMSGSASADCLSSEGSTVFALKIDATSSCSNMSSNMKGCDIGVGENNCMIPNSGITVTIRSGGVGSNTPIEWSASGGKIDFAIVGGAANGTSTCGYSYTPGASGGGGLIFEKSNGSSQKVTSLSFCSDLVEPAATGPRLIVTKTVTTIDDVMCASGVNSLDIGVSLEDVSVRYCYTVENVGAGVAGNVTLCDDAGTPTPGVCDPVGTDDFDVALDGLNGGSLDSGGTATGTSVVIIDGAGTVVDTATATASGFGGTITATDTTTVNAVLVAEICPQGFQAAVNDLSVSTGLDYAFLLDPNKGGRLAVCVPNGEPSTSGEPTGNTIRIRCIDQCVTKPECETDPSSNPACSPSVCEPSGAWTATPGTPGMSCDITDPPRGVAPFCWEVQQDLNKDCMLNGWEPQEEIVLNVKKGHVNPYVWQSCYSSGGRYVCETMCYAFSAADALACPPGSTVF